MLCPYTLSSPSSGVTVKHSGAFGLPLRTSSGGESTRSLASMRRARGTRVRLASSGGERPGARQDDPAGADRSEEPVLPTDQIFAVPAARAGAVGRLLRS